MDGLKNRRLPDVRSRFRNGEGSPDSGWMSLSKINVDETWGLIWFTIPVDILRDFGILKFPIKNKTNFEKKWWFSGDEGIYPDK